MIKDITVQVGGKFPHPSKQYTSIQASVSLTCTLSEAEQNKKVLEARVQDLRTLALDELRKSFKMQLQSATAPKSEAKKPVEKIVREPGQDDGL